MMLDVLVFSLVAETMGGSDSKPEPEKAPKKSSDSGGSGYKGKKWGDQRSDAEKARDEHNKPAGYKGGASTPSWVKEKEMEQKLDKDVHKVKKKYAYQQNEPPKSTPKVSSRATAKPAAAHMAAENSESPSLNMVAEYEYEYESLLLE